MEFLGKTMLGSRPWNGLWLIIAAALTVVIALAAATMPWRDAISTIAAASPGWFLAAIACYLMIFPFWALQWQLLTSRAHAAPLRAYFQITVLYYPVSTVVPMVGPPSALGLLMTVGRLSPAAALAVYALDQTVTGIAKLLMVILALLLVPLPLWIQTAAATLFVIVIACATGLGLLAYGRGLLQSAAARLRGFIGRLAKLIAACGDHLEPLRHGSRAWYAMLLGVAKKLMEVASALAIQKACGLPLDFDAAVLIVAALSLASVLPAAPAHLGVYEATVVIVYQMFGVAPATALAAAVLQHAAELLVSIGSACSLVLARQLGGFNALRS
jgi:uncharacterized membrane protein YbhN (UPF0104 family)